jgi:Phospholipase A2
VSLQAQPSRRHLPKQNIKVVDFFLNAIKKFITPSVRDKKPKNETTKGLDFKLDPANTDLAPTFGDHQDIQLIYVGTKWCGAGNIAKNKRDIGYFYMTGKSFNFYCFELRTLRIS